MPQIPIKTWFLSKYEKFVVSTLIVALFTTQVFSFPVAQAIDLIPDFIDGGAGDPINELVTIVVDQDLDNDNNKYPGLTGNAYKEYLGTQSVSLGHRVTRYANDIKDENPGTDVKILFYDKQKDSVPNLANALENMYINGEGSRNNRLSGVVLVGDIPLPVVNKEGNRFVSMYPYTDFYNKAYIYNPETLAFERNAASSFPQPEVWHGVINGTKSELAEYFDKNHLYYEGVNEYAKFEKRMFFGDLIHEEEMTNKDVYKVYMNYLKYMEDLAYMRYNKHWANALMGSVIEETFGEDGIPVNLDFDAPDLDPPPGSGVAAFTPEDFKDNLNDGNAMAQMPDIHSKSIIDKYAAPYYTIFPKFIARINDFADQTGRYKAAEMDSIPELISIKDEYTKTYLRLVNDAVENKINSIIEEIEQPMPLVAKSIINGAFTGGDSDPIYFSLSGLDIYDMPGLSNKGSTAYINYNYSPDGYFINGRSADYIDNPKQCSVFMGSTRTSYFDENLDYNPMRTDLEGDHIVNKPEYSILTRAIRSDDALTAQPLRTFGLNTRVLSTNDALEETKGVASNGALVEPDVELGLPPYIESTHESGNPFLDKIGGYSDTDTLVITKINNIPIDYNYTVEQAAKNSYDLVKKIIEVYNNDDMDDQMEILDYFSPFTVFGPNTSGAIPVFGTGTVTSALGGLKIEFILNGTKSVTYTTFTVHYDEEDYKTSNSYAETSDGGPELFVNLSGQPVTSTIDAQGFEKINIQNFGNVFSGQKKSDGVIFTMYDMKTVGRDISMYCNASAAGQYSDRCLYYVANYPVYDPGGSIALSKGEEPNDDKLMFKENVKREQVGSQSVNSINQSDYDDHTYILQYPDGYTFEQIDEVIWNSCYEGYYKTESTNVLEGDKNFYGDLIESLEDFGKNSAPDAGKNDSEEGPGNIWHDKDAEMVPANVVLSDNPIVKIDPPGIDSTITLKTFTDRYGLWDGIDNDNDGIRDYEWRDTDEDGVYDQKYIDFNEASSVYGISSKSFQEIARKMLSHETTYTVPKGSPSPEGGYGLVLNVKTNEEKQISSMIIHNEPTEKTIFEQMKNMTTMALPIDNPRYVVFQAQSEPLPKYPDPDPVDPAMKQEDIQAIKDKLDFTEHYVPGQMVEVEYPNVFEVDSIALYKVKLAGVAVQLAVLPGAYEVFGSSAKEEDYEPIDIFDEIFNNHLLPVVTSETDNPYSGFDLNMAAEKKIVDSLAWAQKNIDEKHQYILDSYLDDDKNAYVGDWTNFPKQVGEDLGFGYEAAYLVLDGEEDYFDMRFNKDLPEETSGEFNPIVAMEQYANSPGPEGVVVGDTKPDKGDDDGGGGDGEGLEFVDLAQFIKELTDFIAYFTTEPDLAEACGASDKAKEDIEKLEEGVDPSAAGEEANELVLASLEASSDRTLISANGKDSVNITIVGLDANGASGASWKNVNTVTLNIDQNESDPVFILNDTPEKILSNGKAEYTLQVTDRSGNVTVSATTDSGIQSNGVTLFATGAMIELNSYTYFEPDGIDELLGDIAAQEDSSSSSGSGDGTGDGSDGVGDTSGGDGDDSGDGDGVGTGTSSGSGDSDATEGSGGDGEGVGAEDGDGLDRGEKIDVDGISPDVEKDINKILTETEEDEDSEVTVDESEGERDPAEDEETVLDEHGNIVILKSELVEEEEGILRGEDEEEDPVEVEWEEYYLDTDYYLKFLDDLDLESSHSRWVAEIYSDQMLAYIPDSENPFVDASKNPESPYFVVSNDEFVADGESLMKVTASVFDGDGDLDQDNPHEVKFSVVESDYPNMITFENGSTATTENGIATVYLRSGTKAGKFVVQAEVLDGLYPLQTKELYVVPGEPTSIEIVPETAVLVANNQSKTSVTVKLRDKFGNLANNAFASVALFTDANTYIDPKADTNSRIIGTQIGTIDGMAKFDLYAKDQLGQSKLIALLLDYDLEEKFLEVGSDWEDIDFSDYTGNSKAFDLVDSVDIDLILDKQSLQANGSDSLKIRTELKHNGKVIDSYNGPISYTLLNKGLGSFTKTPPEKMVNGVLHQENVKFKSSKSSGTVEILVDVPGFVSDTVEFKTLPGLPVYIELTSSEDTLTTNNLDEVVLKASLLDQYGNLVDTNNSKIVQFSATNATKGLITFKEAQSSVVSGGIASNRIKAKDVSGEVNIIASSSGLESDKITLEITKHITGSIAEEFAPRALYMSVLGGAFGMPMDGSNLAQRFMFSDGQVQAVSSVTASVKDVKRLVSIDSYGKIEALSETVLSEIVPATDSFPYQKVVFTDSLTDASLATAFVIPKGNAPVSLLEDDEEISGTGIYVVKPEEPDDTLEFVVEKEDVLIQRSGETKVKVDKYGRISVNDERFELVVPGESFSNYGFHVVNNGKVVAEIEFRMDGAKNVSVLNYDTAISSFVPGVYLQLNTNDSRYGTSSAPSRYASDEALGVFLNDLESDIESTQAPRFSYSSLESASEEFGLGYEGSNKHMLLFASGNSVGESNLPYASEAAIIYGDPTVKVKIEGIVGMVSELTGYSKVIGKQILASDKPIKEMLSFDYNDDGREDVLILYEDGLVRLLENENSNKKFRDRGFVMNIYGGILSGARIDVNDDGYDDLVVGTQDSCREGEECVTLMVNDNGVLKRETLNLDIEGKIYNMVGRDMNNDGCEDLVVSDSASNIRIFYNKKTTFSCTGLEEKYGGQSHNYGFIIDSNKELKESLFIYYSGVKAVYDGDPMKNFEDSERGDYVTFMLETSTPPNPGDSDAEAKKAQYAADAKDLQDSVLTNPNIANLSAPPQTYKKDFDFRHLPKDPRFGVSTTKRGLDENGGNLAVGDNVSYTITLQNSLPGTVDVMVSDFIPQNMTLIEDSLHCLDSCATDPYFEDTGMSLRPKVIHTDVPSGGKRILTYTVTVDQLPELQFDLGNNFADYPVNDNYSDIFVRPPVNPTGALIYLYSDGVDANGYVLYKEYKKTLQDTEDPASKAFDDAFGEIIPGKKDIQKSIKFGDPTVLTLLGGSLAADSDGNGCVDAWSALNEDYKNITGAIAGGIEDATAMLRCGGAGCSPIPYNKALFAPSAEDPGMDIVSIWPPMKYVGFAENMYASAPSNFRLYMSPTLSLGLGTAFCFGPGGGAGQCMAFAIPVGGMGLCDALEGAMDSAMSAVSNVVTSVDVGLTSVVSSGDEATSSDAVNENFGSSDPNSPFAMGGSVNVKVPGFPSVITNWIDKQTDEIYNKLLDLPDFYFIYPDMGGLFDQFSQSFDKFGKDENGELKLGSLDDFMSAINSIPLVQIEGREVLVKIPALSQKEIAKWQRQAEHWLKHHENEVNRLINYACVDKKIDGTHYVHDETQERLCDKLTADMTDLIQSIRSLMEKVDSIANLPRDVLNWRYLESKYATQIVCYMDAIINYTGGYLKKQQKTIKSWMKAIEDVIKVFRDWKVILDLMVEFKSSCDECKNDRFGKLGLLMQLFAAIPEPPIIPMPKWPDIVFDVSQIKAGIKIVWPDLVFRPEAIKLPDLPYITFPDVVPNIGVAVPGFDLPSWLKDFPNLVLPDLPDLPPLPLPDLPDLPRPPKIPALPKIVAQLIANLKPIFKILCLLKNGYMPIAENQLATEIETLTQSNVSMVIPIIAKLGVQIPGVEYEYVEQIKITAKLSMGIDTEALYNVVKMGADFMNDKIEWIIDELNNLLAFPVQQYIDAAIQYAEEKAQEGIATGLGEVLEGVEEATGLDTSSSASLLQASEADFKNEIALSNMAKSLGIDNDPFADLEASMNDINSILEEYTAQIESANEDYPETFYLTATQSYLDPEDPILNRTIEDVERGIIAQDLPDDPAINNMVALRDSMIAYTKNLDNSNDLLQSIDDYSEFTRILVDNDDSVRPFASLAAPLEASGDIEELSGSLFGPAEEEAILVAANVSSSSSASEKNAAANQVPTGWFIGKDGKNENIIGYTKELKGMKHFFSDVDDDGDIDIVYSMAGDVFVKENFEINEEQDEGEVIISLSNSDVDDYLENGKPSIQNVEVPYSGSKQVDISWAKPNYDVAGYEVRLKDSIYDDVDEYSQRYVAVPGPLDNEEPNEETINLLDAIGLKPDDEEVEELPNPDAPGLSVSIENGSYYVTVLALDKDGNSSLPSESYIISPQICADDDMPFPIVSSSAVDVSIFKTVEINASASFDPTGEIVDYYMETTPNLSQDITTLPNPLWSDINTLKDENGDGKLNNDKSNPIFNIGPFEKSGDVRNHQMTLHVTDETNNDASQNVLVNVFAPEISLDETFSRLSVATGVVTPPLSRIPFILLRSRYIYRVVDEELVLVPRVDKVVTSDVDSEGKYIGKYLTDDLGEYEISGFDTNDMILVEDASGNIVAEIHPETGNIGGLKPGYSYIVHPALPPEEPTRIEILDKDKIVVGTIYLVADSNIDVTTYEGMSFGADNTSNLNGVHVSDINNADAFVLKAYGSNNPTYPGGAALTLNDSPIVIFDTSGNIILTNKSISLDLKRNNHQTDPLVIDVKNKGNLAAEVYISPAINNVHIVGPNDVPFSTPRPPSAAAYYGSISDGKLFADTDDDLNAILENLYAKDIVEGEQTDNGLNFNPDELVERAEFVKVLLKMLCIIPRESAYLPYESNEANGGFTDIVHSDPLAWYYAYVKEAALRGLINGYLGEVDSTTGLTPFRPEGTITRAEATKVILEALEMQGVINMGEVPLSTPWYENYMEIGQDLSPYMAPGKLIKNNFIVTAQESADANKLMSRADLVTMANRVLDIYNCFEIDANGNGMSDFCEEKYEITDPQGDPDGDELTNINECYYGTDPFDKDTDGGGIYDGPEVDIGANPLYNTDDSEVPEFEDIDYEIQEGESGIFAVPADCNTCPCTSTFLHKADIIPGDIFFTAIMTLDEEHMFSKSNEVVIESVTP